MKSINVSIRVPVETDEVIEGAVNPGGDRQDEGKWTRDGKFPQGFRSWKVAPNLKRWRMDGCRMCAARERGRKRGRWWLKEGAGPLGCDPVTATSPGGRAPGSGTS